MRGLIISIFLVITFVGCSNYSEEFIVSGEITQVEDNIIYVERKPIKVGDTDEFKVGQKVKISLIDTTSEDDWDVNDFRVKKIEHIK